MDPRSVYLDELRDLAGWLLLFVSAQAEPEANDHQVGVALGKTASSIRALRERVDLLQRNRYLVLTLSDRLREYWRARNELRGDEAQDLLRRVQGIARRATGHDLTKGQIDRLTRDDVAKEAQDSKADDHAAWLLGIAPSSLRRIRKNQNPEKAPMFPHWLRADGPSDDYTARHEILRFTVCRVLGFSVGDFRNVLAVLDMLPQDNAPEGVQASIPVHPHLKRLRDAAQGGQAIKALAEALPDELPDCGPDSPA